MNKISLEQERDKTLQLSLSTILEAKEVSLEELKELQDLEQNNDRI